MPYLFTAALIIILILLWKYQSYKIDFIKTDKELKLQRDENIKLLEENNILDFYNQRSIPILKPFNKTFLRYCPFCGGDTFWGDDELNLISCKVCHCDFLFDPEMSRFKAMIMFNNRILYKPKMRELIKESESINKNRKEETNE